MSKKSQRERVESFAAVKRKLYPELQSSSVMAQRPKLRLPRKFTLTPAFSRVATFAAFGVVIGVLIVSLLHVQYPPRTYKFDSIKETGDKALIVHIR